MIYLDVITKIITIIGVIGIIVGVFNYTRAKKIEEIRFLLELKSLFSKFDAISEAIVENKDVVNDDKQLLHTYIGSFELMYHMLEKGVLSDKMFRSQYEYRIACLLKNKAVLKYIENNSESLTEFNKLITKLYPNGPYN